MGKLSPEVTDEGRPGCPTGQIENFVEATAGRASLFYKERLGTKSPPLIRPSVRTGHLPPGKGRVRGKAPSCPRNQTPSPPSRWAGRYGRKNRGRRPGRKKERTPAGSPKPEGGSREEEPLPGSRFLRLSSKESGSPPGGQRALRPNSGTRRVRSTAPPKKRDTPKGIPTFYSTVSWMEPVAFFCLHDDIVAAGNRRMGSRCVAKHFRRIVPTLNSTLRRPFRKGQGYRRGSPRFGVPFQRGAAEHGLFPVNLSYWAW